MKVLTPAEMRDLDRRAIEDLGIPEAVLMENAASAAMAVLERQFEPRKKEGLILCGGGNNGGDGLALARKIHSLGRPVKVLLFSPPEKLSPVSKTNLRILQKLAVALIVEPHEKDWRDAIGSSGYLVDALFGTGLNRPVSGEFLEVIRAVNNAGKPVLSLDIPSGIQGLSGEVSPEAVRAEACVTFGNPKWGNILFPGYSFQGKLYCSPISFPPEYYDHNRYTSEINLPPPLPARNPEGYKSSFGKVLLIGGGGRYYGAPAMAARSLYRSGCGYVTVAIPRSLCAAVSTLCPEAVLKPLDETEEGNIHSSNRESLLRLAEEQDGVILGPGIARQPQTQELIRQIIPEIPVPLLMDADALSALAGHPELTIKRSAATILTPHKGEQRALLSGSPEGSRIEEIYGAITLYKGPHSRIRTPEGREYINMTGNSGLGTAGTGDILTGVIMALIKGLPPVDAVRTGVLLHGLAGDLAADTLGEDSLTATDLLDFLPPAIQFYRKNHTALTESCYNKIHRLL